MYTVKQLAELAGITNRTLHYYDEIGLLEPTIIAQNGYRYYDDQALFRLQQILLYREMALELTVIKKILDQTGFDPIAALQMHRENLEGEIDRLKALVGTVDATIMHLTGEIKMSKKNIFEGFSAEKQKQYEEEATRNWGDTVKQSMKLWNSYSEEKKQAVMQESSAIYKEIIANMQRGPTSPEIQSALARWHQHLRHFYEPSLETLKGLGEMYHDHPDFNATFTAMHPDLPAFLKNAIAIYVDELETQWLEKELGILRDQQ